MSKTQRLHSNRPFRGCCFAAKEPRRERRSAVVLGGSMAGLLAARVLAEHFEHVTVVERDVWGGAPEPRKGVPQGRHAHVLLASGARSLERLFPGIGAEMVAAGAVLADAGSEGRIWAEGDWFAPCAAGLHTFVATRPLIEAQVRARLSCVGNVEFLEGADATGMCVAAGRVVAVCIAKRDCSRREQIESDFVVDATGRGSRLPRWLVAWGYEAPREESAEVGVGYTSCVAPRSARDSWARATVVAPSPANMRGGIALAVERDRWLITLVGYKGQHAPAEMAGFREFARSLSSKSLAQLLERVEPATELVAYKYPRSQRRRYDQVARSPRRVLALGDALCSFNPVFGQGMSVAALESRALSWCLETTELDGVADRFYKRSKSLLDAPWSMVNAADRRVLRASEAPLAEKIASGYVARLQRAAARDPAAARAVLEAMHLVKPPSSIFAPDNLYRACRYGDAALRPGLAPLHTKLFEASVHAAAEQPFRGQAQAAPATASKRH